MYSFTRARARQAISYSTALRFQNSPRPIRAGCCPDAIARERQSLNSRPYDHSEPPSGRPATLSALQEDLCRGRSGSVQSVVTVVHLSQLLEDLVIASSSTSREEKLAPLLPRPRVDS